MHSLARSMHPSMNQCTARVYNDGHRLNVRSYICKKNKCYVKRITLIENRSLCYAGRCFPSQENVYSAKNKKRAPQPCHHLIIELVWNCIDTRMMLTTLVKNKTSIYEARPYLITRKVNV